MADQLVSVQHPEDGVCLLRLERPAKLNALSEELTAQFLALVESDAVRTARALVISGSGRAFCAGADLTEFRDPSPEDTARYYRGPGQIWEVLPRLPQPSIAAIHGYAIGGGAELALSADLRVADETAVFGFPEVSLGILPSAGGMTRLVRLLGVARAKELILLGERFDARRALELGVVNRVVEPGRAEAQAIDWAGALARQPQLALQTTRSLIDRSDDVPLSASIELEKLAQGMLAMSPDAYRAQ
jgi:enoyl-CoA hydratase/carnithine racemase